LTSSGNRHSKRGSIVRLKFRDSSLYGHCPQTDPFAVVVCRHCRMVLKAPCLKGHIERRHDKDRKYDLAEAVVKLEKYTERPTVVDKTSGVTEKFDKISVVLDKYEKIPSFNGIVEKVEKVDKNADLKQRQRHFQRKSTTPSESNDSTHFDSSQSQTIAVPSTTESSSASNSPQPKRRKRKHLVVETATATANVVETFQTTAKAPTACVQHHHRIIVEPSEIVIRDARSPPPLAPITNEPHPSVWIVTPSPAVIIDGSFMVKPILEQQEAEPEIDLKDLKVLKPLVKETLPDTHTLLTPSNWYATQPRPLAVNTFNLRKLNAQRYVMATQRKLIELGRNLRTEEKVVGGKVSPKTWSFLERSQVSFIPFRVSN
jgi:hypothetical protein